MLEILLEQIIKSFKKQLLLAKSLNIRFHYLCLSYWCPHIWLMSAEHSWNPGSRWLPTVLCPQRQLLLPVWGRRVCPWPCSVWQQFRTGRDGPHSVWIRGFISLFHVPLGRNLVTLSLLFCYLDEVPILADTCSGDHLGNVQTPKLPKGGMAKTVGVSMSSTLLMLILLTPDLRKKFSLKCIFCCHTLNNISS